VHAKRKSPHLPKLRFENSWLSCSSAMTGSDQKEF
jgi:hypothetical protein